MSILSRIGVAASQLDFTVKQFLRALMAVTTVAAAGSDETDATALTAAKNMVTAADGAKGVILPVAQVDMAVEVVNTVSNQDLLVYPNTGAQINALTATTGAFTLGAGQSAVFYCDAALHWYVRAASITTGVATDATTAELNVLADVTPGTGAASKALVLDAGDDLTFPAAGVLTIGNIATAVEAAEHGAGAIGTAAAPQTFRWIEHGVIVTQTKIDLTGLASVADADDVIGLAAGGAAYIGRNVVAANGVVFKAQLACLETPAGGDNDIDLKTSSSAAAAYDGDGAAFGSVFNSGDWVAGTCRETLVPALTANDYFYLTAGTGDVADTYTAGMFVLTTYGHPALA